MTLSLPLTISLNKWGGYMQVKDAQWHHPNGITQSSSRPNPVDDIPPGFCVKEGFY